MSRPCSTRRLVLMRGLSAAGVALATAALLYFSAHPVVSALLVSIVAAIFVFHLRQLLGCIRELEDEPDPTSGETLEAWIRQGLAAGGPDAPACDLFDNLFDIFLDGVLFLDADNRILRANAAASSILARLPDRLIGVSLSEASGQEALAQLADAIRSTGSDHSAEIYLPSIPGPGHVAGIPLRPGKDAGRAPVMLVLRDITAVRRLESAGDEYATNVSHELKTPLTLILGYTETLLSQGAADPGFQERSLRTIERHTKRIIRIIDDLMRLAWLRNEAAATGIPRAVVSLAAIIDEAVGICREWARAAGIDIETHVPEGLVWNLNSGLLEEAIINLVKNAILYALVGPIEIRVRVLDNGRLEIAVIDRGPGLKPEDATRIFDRFYRADKSRTRASGGSGLGLPIVQQIVEAHHGSARVETAPGKGCTFLLEIPPGPPVPPAAT